MSYKALIFDLDGTLLNTIDDLGDSANHILCKLGFPTHTIDEYKYFVGNGIPKPAARQARVQGAGARYVYGVLCRSQRG